MTDQVDRWAEVEREERETILRQFEEEACKVATLPTRDRSVLAGFRIPLELAFATVLGALCALVSVLAAVLLKIFLG